MSLTNGNGEKLKALADNVYLRLISQVTSAIALPVVVYLLLTLNGQGTAITQLQGAIEGIRTELSLRTISRYTADDAKRDQALTDSRFTDIERRLNRLEQR